MSAADAYRVEVAGDIASIDAVQWDRLLPDEQPFISHAFLSLLEQHNCVGSEAGWLPQHLVARDRDNSIVAAMPLYAKDHSWGEFVFDFAWAQAYSQAGLEYYPKLVSMAPFTPVSGARLLAAPGHEKAGTAMLRFARDLAKDSGASSIHVLYPLATELPALEDEAMMLREDVRFMWQNHGYRDFDDFLATFSASKRKKLRRERRRIKEQGIGVTTVPAASLSPGEWQAVYDLCSATFYRRGHAPYLSLEFFCELAGQLQEQMLVNLARINEQLVGAAILFRDNNTLYGRYWGGIEGLDCLHFETCYYRGIDYCIEHQLQNFDPGTQGEHKLRRGFAPTTTWSAHWIADPRFALAIANYLRQEREHVARYAAELQQHLPFRRDI
ncbi:MAG: GNAT family N-acetyltransferase [Gammaproteobacteria bacterium]|nr:GNAT family N-acetyltransferase [Gammaproteobacteria bacterium]NNF62560.1 GNAT family N-acetyltransferase [Gammaproteobacteria bacterium]NNM20737.1 GNAT family N-acetyltransferase [Gammaproteobacteria bacterium]